MIKIIFIQVLLVLLGSVNNAQISDSFYNLGSKYNNANEKELAKKCLLTLINRQMNHQDSSGKSSVLGYSYYMNLSYDLLKMIFFEEKDYVNALVYNEKQFKFNRIEGVTRGIEDLIMAMTRDSFSAECYYAMKDYHNAMEISSRNVADERMITIFVNSASYSFGEEALKDEFLEEFGKVVLPEWRVVYDSSDIKYTKKKIFGPQHVNLTIFGYRLNIYVMEIIQIRNDLIDNKITGEIANNRLKEEIKKRSFYKLIMKE